MCLYVKLSIYLPIIYLIIPIDMQINENPSMMCMKESCLSAVSLVSFCVAVKQTCMLSISSSKLRWQSSLPFCSLSQQNFCSRNSVFIMNSLNQVLPEWDGVIFTRTSPWKGPSLLSWCFIQLFYFFSFLGNNTFVWELFLISFYAPYHSHVYCSFARC